MRFHLTIQIEPDKNDDWLKAWRFKNNPEAQKALQHRLQKFTENAVRDLFC